MELKAREPSTYGVKILRRLPHRGQPWTQGFEFSDDGRYLIESVGDWPTGQGSLLRTIDPSTGEVLKTSQDGLSSPMFAEGIAQAGAKWFMSTYTNHVVLEYDADFNLVKRHPYVFQGWGLARTPDGESFVATNSSEYLLFLDQSFRLRSAKRVTCLGYMVPGLNELEVVHDFHGHGPTLLANLINTRYVLAVDLETAECSGVVDLHGLGDVRAEEQLGFHVANGIAYDRKKGTLWLTGKNWDTMFEVSLERSAGQAPAFMPSFRDTLQSLR